MRAGSRLHGEADGEAAARDSACRTASRTRGSRRSKPGGSRRRMSRPRPLTLRTSQCQRTPPLAPSARAKPVMLLMVMARFRWRHDAAAEAARTRARPSSSRRDRAGNKRARGCVLGRTAACGPHGRLLLGGGLARHRAAARSAPCPGAQPAPASRLRRRPLRGAGGAGVRRRRRGAAACLLARSFSTLRQFATAALWSFSVSEKMWPPVPSATK